MWDGYQKDNTQYGEYIQELERKMEKHMIRMDYVQSKVVSFRV